MKIYLAPIQGITTYPFRHLFSEYFGGVDKYFSPFIRFEKGNEIRQQKLKDILPEKNTLKNLIPQVMTNSPEELLKLDELVAGMGYSEMNLNMGCPHAMVTNRKLGAGILPHTDLIQDMLDKALPALSCKLSLKLRSGYENPGDIIKLMPLLDKYPLEEVIIHPRIGRQMYKGMADQDVFEECLKLTKHTLCYNGDINSLKSFVQYSSRFELTKTIMLGRGLVTNPFLAKEIKGLFEYEEADKAARFLAFHNELLEHYKHILSGDAHVIQKMLGYWEYFSSSFSNGGQIYKSLKKSKKLDSFENVINNIVANEQWVI